MLNILECIKIHINITYIIALNINNNNIINHIHLLFHYETNKTL